MPFWRTSYHLVWTTYQREALIMPEIEARLYAYIIHTIFALSQRISSGHSQTGDNRSC